MLLEEGTLETEGGTETKWGAKVAPIISLSFCCICCFLRFCSYLP